MIHDLLVWLSGLFCGVSVATFFWRWQMKKYMDWRASVSQQIDDIKRELDYLRETGHELYRN